MGVSLSGIIEGKETEFEELQGKAIAIDAYNTLYQFLSIIRDRFTGEPLRDSKGRVTSHLSGLFYRTSRMIEAGIRPVFIFDGEPPEFKKETIETRGAAREEARKKWKEAVEKGEIEKVRLYAQGAARLTDEMVEQSKTLLDLMGIPWIQAPSEGEAQAAYMVRKGQAWGVGSQDWDSLLFGAPRLVKNLTISGRRKVPRKEKYITIKPEIIELENVLKTLHINQDQLIILGILTGTDYNPGGVKGIGPKTALKIVSEKKTLENILKGIEWNFKVSPREIFDFFRNPKSEEAEIKPGEINTEKLEELLVEEYEFSKDRIENTINKLREGKEKGKQTGLGQFVGK